MNSQAAPAGVPASLPSAHLNPLETAVQMHQAGKLAEAEVIYRQVLAREPGNFDALHMLGVLHHQRGRHEQAAELIEQAIGQEGHHPFAQNNLGEAWRAMGRFAGAEACYRKAIALFPEYAEAYNNLGLALVAQDRPAEAQACFEQALSLKPRYAKALYNLANVHRTCGHHDAALSCYEKALSLNPDYHEALHALAGFFEEQGQLHKALLCCQKTLHIHPADDSYWTLYADIIQLLDDVAAASIEVPILVAAFGKDALDPQKLERMASTLICRDANAQPLLSCIDSPDNATAAIHQAMAEGKLDSFVTLPLLLVLLQQALVTHQRLEQLLTAIRSAMLTAYLSGDTRLKSEAWMRFAAALALQCFANEYVYSLSEAEQSGIREVSARLAPAMQSGAPDAALPLALMGAYVSLHAHESAENMRSMAWPDTLRLMVQRQVWEPLEERRLKGEIPQLTPIADIVSQKVRQQYEENPYPRWRRRGRVDQGERVHASLQRRLPHQDIPDESPEQPEVLIAGCGTGSDAAQVARLFKNARIQAVDISLTSLAYAMRATREFGISNIEFGQADILQLASLNKRFDVIVCSGVLHHMENPLAGWRVLAGLLQAKGYMNIGLYSRRARTEITAMRELIRDAGYASDLEGIRRFRSDVMHGRCKLEAGSLLISPDFYSASACRDLVFHVQEHVYSPLEIQSHLDELGLRFLGFEFPNPEIRKRYLARFPDNPACDSLANWDIVEQEHPLIFAGMYQFWVCKK